MFLIAHLADTHLNGEARSRERLARVAAYIRGLEQPADAIVVTGDIVQPDAPGEYQFVADTLGGMAPVLYCPGNTDPHAAFRAAFVAGADTKASYKQDVGTVTFIMLDGHVPGETYGELGDATSAWLDRTLAETPPDRPVVLALHYHPIDVAHPLLVELGLRDAPRLADAIARHPNVVLTLAGHTHAATVTTFAGRPFVITQGVHSGQHLPWERSDLVQAVLDEDQPPALALHFIHDDWRVTTNFRTVI
jgi:3',5'-cyclic AMP phosphodiesterase CpdA